MKADSLWRNREFNLLWTGQLLSGLGARGSGLGGAMASLTYPLITLAIPAPRCSPASWAPWPW